MTLNLKVLFIKGQRKRMRQRNNDEDGEAFAKRLKVTPLNKPTVPLDEIVHLRTAGTHFVLTDLHWNILY